ncbi:hypothetical protein Q73A0000_05165 [Kaistella flava (ex Peng et al. 2021)]|uniref:Peptidase C1A papain C-terminal domain-containing protein n=1 Tax=Kaistella flava (ex Peng et al. 2021) TaxID=2038776 RepID=A0A7M2Y6T9_9FLAO|nr:C1 family peptidase [Kaistella flava (ex Peng et al. 2021)]QOW09800.1 hypothetical protein Q73A0000_05165 [Kaistella flava (ex Peng et al. 2021)]
MPSSSINIGINRQGKRLVDKINLHYKNHEPDFYNNHILNAAMESGDTGHKLFTLSQDQFVPSHNDDTKVWFDVELYGEVRRLSNLINETVGSSIDVNIIFSICDKEATSQLKLLLEAIRILKDSEQISGVDVKLFVILYELDNTKSSNYSGVQQELISITEMTQEYDSILTDIYYLDDRNVGQVILNLNTEWLAFALAEFIVFEMLKERSGAILRKSKIFGVGVIHFNEVLFRNVIQHTILQYKFEDEGILDEDAVVLRDLYRKCNPFIESHQNFFTRFLEAFPYTSNNSGELTLNSKKYISDFKGTLEQFITNEEYKVGESKTLLAHLLGEDDNKLEGINWSGERLDINDLEFDVINYFNKYLEENDRVKYPEQKARKNSITELSQGIKREERILRDLEETSNEIYRNLNVSFKNGTFSLDGKRINASGYIPSPINPSDEFYTYPDENIPTSLDLSMYLSAVKNQGDLKSCTAFPISTVYEFFAQRNRKNVNISELFIYYNSRELNGNINNDSGATLVNAIHAVKEKGACYTKMYPYDTESFSQLPTDDAYSEAKHQVVSKASRINITETDFKHAIANGHPVIIGLKIFESFYPQDASGIIPFPLINEAEYEQHGNHALLVVGYNDEEKLFKIRNSWGEEFGDRGYGYAPYDYIANPKFCHEAFVITEIVDLSYEKFTYDENSNFSFLKDATIRRKLIVEYQLRAKKRELKEVKIAYDDLAFQNERNSEQIKDPIFRRRLLDQLMVATPNVSVQEPIVIKKPQNKMWGLLIMVIGTTFIRAAIALKKDLGHTGLLIAIGLGVIIILIGVVQLFRKKTVSENPVPVTATPRFGEQDRYAFEAADNLFEAFDGMRQNLVRRYKAISNYYTRIKEWQIESKKKLDKIEYNSPDFVINVIKKEPLLHYLEMNKSEFLRNLINFSTIFHRDYDPASDNVDQVYNDLYKNYFLNISENIDGILEMSIVDYIQNRVEYPYLEPAPVLQSTIRNIQNVSMPFCNIKQTANSINIQNYVIHEKISSNEDSKLSEFARHRDAAINPILTFRSDNKKKYVAIQVAAIENVEDIARFNL